MFGLNPWKDREVLIWVNMFLSWQYCYLRSYELHCFFGGILPEKADSNVYSLPTPAKPFTMGGY